MMKIGILEFLYHHIFFYSLASIAKESGTDVTLFTTKNLQGLVAPIFKDKVQDYKWVIKGEDEKLWSFLKRVEQTANRELDLLFVNTLQGGAPHWLLYWMFAPKCKTILVTGRITEWFGGKYRFTPQRDIKGLLNHNARHFFTKKILPRFDGIVVHTKTMEDYALAHHYEKDIFVLPFSIFDGHAPIEKNTREIKFIVTGMIVSHRRDYDGLLDTFVKPWSSGGKGVVLTLLGSPIGEYGERIISRCRLLRERGFDIRFYTKYIPEGVFMSEMESADVLLNPIKPANYIHGMFMSGLVEAIRHAKPGIYPVGYSVPEELLSSSLFYSEIKELPHLIEDKFLNNREFLKELSRNALSNSEKYSLEKVSSYFKEHCARAYAPLNL